MKTTKSIIIKFYSFSFQILLLSGIPLLLKSVVFSQSKKEQIQILSNRLDSLKSIEKNEFQSFLDKKNNLTQEFNKLELEIQSQKDSIEISQYKKKVLKIQTEGIENENIRLRNELKRIKDSIDLFWKNQTVQFIESPLFSMSEEEIILYMNITYEEILKKTQEEWDVNDLNGSNKEILIKVIGSQYFEQDNKLYCMSVLGIDNNFGIGPGPLCVGVQEYRENKWVLIDKEFEFSPTPNAEFSKVEKFIKIGKKTIGVETSQLLQPGKLTIVNNSIFAFLDNKIIDVYDGFIHSFNPDYKSNTVVETECELLIIENDHDFFDFKVIISETGKTPITHMLKFNLNSMKYE